MKYDHGGRPGVRIDASVNLNPLGPPASLAGMFERARDLASRYPEIDAGSARKAWAQRVGVAAQELLVGNGASELISLAIRALAPSRVIAFEPCYSEYASAAEAFGAHVERLGFELQDTTWTTPLDAYEPREGDLLVMGQPNNPTGHLTRPEALADIARRGAHVLVDESFLPFLADAETRSLAARRPPGLSVVCSLTKVFCIPGLRLGWFAGDAALVAEMSRLRDPWAVNGLAAEAAVTLASDNAYLAETRSWLSLERPRLARELAAIPGLHVTEGVAPYVLAELPEGFSAAALIEAAAGHGIAVRNASTFAGLGPRWVRIGLRSAEENDEIVSAVRGFVENGRR